jgi:enoyl-CoA hydratase/carnithine racemase
MIRLEKIEQVSVVTIDKPKVNALDSKMLSELDEAFSESEKNPNIKAILIQGAGSFFSFGLDIPFLLGCSREQVEETLRLLLNTCRDIYLSKKITISSINGHATGAGCMLAISTDYRFMARERAKIALNEINIGLSLFPSTIFILKSLVGNNHAKQILLGGEMMDSESALRIGLVDQVFNKDELKKNALEFARLFASKDSAVISSMKSQLVSDATPFLNDSNECIKEFLDIFYSSQTQEILENIEIRK